MNNEQLISRYAGWMGIKNLSSETVKSYLIEMRVFLKFLEDRSLVLSGVKKSDILDFLAFLAAEDVGVKARNRTVYALRSLFNCLLDYEYVGSNPTVDIRRSKTEKNKHPTYLEPEELDDFLSYDELNKYRNRNLLIMALMSYMGLRVGEVVRLDLKNIERATQTLAVNGKGNSWRYLPIPEDFMILIDEYLKERIEPVKEEDGSKPLFVSQFKKRMSRRMMQHLATCLFNELTNKYPELKDIKLSAHKLRHTFATNQLRDGTDLSTLQSLLGHSDISTTSIYVHTNKRHLVDAMNRVKVNLKMRPKDVE